MGLKLENIGKTYPNGSVAVQQFNMEIKDGEFIVLVGPSGCGKSTTLRMIAGLEEITEGKLFLDDKTINDLAPKDRDISMVFQNYALYAHMSVYHNMAFSLMIRKEESDFIHERIMWAADILGLKPYLNRKPRELSGGQRQRVALGRAIVRDPKIFLLDEPLSNLDAKLRDGMRKELKLLHHRLKTTMIYVTHDQIEALTLGDRIVIMKDGYIQQVGTPLDIYQNPVNLFVASFIGTPPMNLIKAKINELGKIVIDDKAVDIGKTSIYESLKTHGCFGKEIIIGIRPEHLIVEGKMKQDENQRCKPMINYELLGSEALVHFEMNHTRVVSKVSIRENIVEGALINYKFDPNKLYFFDPKTEIRIK